MAVKSTADCATTTLPRDPRVVAPDGSDVHLLFALDGGGHMPGKACQFLLSGQIPLLAHGMNA